MAWDLLHRSEAQDAVLDRLTDRAAAAPGVVALDLDGCLFDNRHRQLAIASAWAARRGDTRLSALRVELFHDWSFTDTLVRLGLARDEARTIAAEHRPFWEERFFGGEYVIHDLPLPGAARFTRRVASAGARVVYLTGRLERQRDGTLANLRRHGFPAEPGDLWTKPRDGMSDVVWKRDGLARLAQQSGPLLAFVDNEPGHINHANEDHPEILGVWVDTDHSPTAPRIAPGTPTLRNFLRTDDWVPPA